MKSTTATQTFTVTLEETLVWLVIRFDDYPPFPTPRKMEELSPYGRTLYYNTLKEMVIKNVILSSISFNRLKPVFDKEEFMTKLLLISYYGHTNIKYKQMKITGRKVLETMSYEFDVKIEF